MKITRREAILLVLLLVFAILFAEYQLVVEPGIERYLELEHRNDELTAQIDSINLDLLVAEQRKEQRDQTLQEISIYHDRFLGELKPSVLFYYTYDLMNRNDFSPIAYTVSPVIDTTPIIDIIDQQDITYALAEIVNEYNILQGSDDADLKPITEETDVDENGDEFEAGINSLELNEFIVSGVGSYEQMKSLLDDIKSQDKSIVVSYFQLNALEDNMIDFILIIQYYGVKKFRQDNDEFNTWPRPDFDGGTESPFASAISSDSEELPEDDEIIEEEQNDSGDIE